MMVAPRSHTTTLHQGTCAMTVTRCLLLAILFIAVESRSFAQDIASGPEKGKAVPALKVYDATGDHKDKDIDYVADRKDKPTIYLLIRADKFDRPMNRFMKTLDDTIVKDFKDVYVVAVWLTEDVDKTKEFLPRVQQSVSYQQTALTCFTGNVKEGPKNWNVNGDAHITVVLANKRKVTATFGYNTINETDAKAVVEGLRKSLEQKKPK
jgi:hypothetical protein